MSAVLKKTDNELKYKEKSGGAWAATGHIHVPRPAGSLRSCKIAPGDFVERP